MVYAVFSCSHFSNGYFHSYDVASTIQDLDFWIHTGDYVYEYGTYASYATDVQERRDEILPEWEQISLQDYRNRMATYHTDEGLQNLRRRAPLIACWDDHEIANNPFGLGTSETSGAENHQEVCTANATSPDTEKDTAGCDRDEGDIVTRFNVAAQSYLEWMPIRRFPGNMGVVDIGSITQVVSWGDMATIVAIDTRVSHRSEDPTVNSNTWGSFFPLATAYTDVSQYTNESSPVFAEIREVAEGVHATLDSDEYTMIGEDIQILKDNFEASKSSGQTWQIWATATAMGRAMKGNYYDLDKLIEDPTTAAAVKAQTDAIFAGETSTFFRALSAEALTSTPWNRDDFSGFANEQRLILEALKETTTNPIILAGDLHDGYGWTLYEDGAIDGTPCAVNLVCPGVTSPVSLYRMHKVRRHRHSYTHLFVAVAFQGWGPFVYPAFSSLSETVGGDDALYSLLEEADEAANPGLKYYNHQYKGFMAVRATKESHVAEFYVHTPETVTSSYEVARAASGTIVAEYACDTQLTTTAGMPGSLDRADECSAITFESERPAVWDLPFPQVADAADLAELSDCGFAECKFATEPAPTSGATVVSGVSALLLLVAVVSTLSL
jgi:alkaline phosphatase D